MNQGQSFSLDWSYRSYDDISRRNLDESIQFFLVIHLDWQKKPKKLVGWYFRCENHTTNLLVSLSLHASLSLSISFLSVEQIIYPYVFLSEYFSFSLSLFFFADSSFLMIFMVYHAQKTSLYTQTHAYKHGKQISMMIRMRWWQSVIRVLIKPYRN